MRRVLGVVVAGLLLACGSRPAEPGPDVAPSGLDIAAELGLDALADVQVPNDAPDISGIDVTSDADATNLDDSDSVETEPCPVARVVAEIDGVPVLNGDPVARGSIISLVAAQGAGEPERWAWSLVEAADRAVPMEDVNAAGAEYRLALSGRYRFELVVGANGCPDSRAELDVRVEPDSAVAIELTWTTDGVELESSADLDLHLIRMPHGLFDPEFDVFVENSEANWDGDQAALVEQSSSGVLPEVIELTPTDCQWYAVGAHLASKTGGGDTWPAIRVFVNGRLIDELVNQPLVEPGDYWDALRIHWPSGTPIRVNEVSAGVSVEDRLTPGTTDEMRDSLLCGTERTP